LVALSKNVYDNEAAFKALGVEVKGAGGGMLPTKDILLQVADVFVGMPDSVTKTKLATELFGKAGADLIPTLNQGKAGITAMMEEAERLGLTFSDEAAAAADDFNDSLGDLKTQAQAATLELVQGSLPALTEMTKALLNMNAEAEKGEIAAGFWSNAFSTAAEAVAALVLNTAFVFQTMGGELMTWARQIKAVFTDGWDAAKKIGDEWAIKAEKMREEVDKGTTAIMTARTKMEERNAALKAGKDAAALSAGEERRLARYVSNEATARAEAAIAAGKKTEKDKEAEAQTKKLAAEVERERKEVEKREEAGAKLIVKLKDQLEEQEAIRRNGGPLNDVQRETVELTKQLRDRVIALTPEQEKEARLLITQTDEAKKQNAERELMKKRIEDVATELAAAYTAQWDEVRAMEASNKELEAQNAKLGMSNAELLAYESNLIDAKIAQIALELAQDDGNVALQQQIDALNERKRLLQEGAMKQEAIDTAAEWAKTAEDIGKGLTDSLYSAFESGKGFFKSLWDGIVNTFKTTALRLVINAVMNPVNAMIGSVLGGSSTLSSAASITGGGGGFDLLSSGASLLGSLGGIGGSLGVFGTAAGYGASALFGGTGLTALAGGASAIGAGSIAAGAGMIAGVLGPIALAAGALYALYSKFKGDAGTPHTGGASWATADGAAAADWTRVATNGGWVATSAKTQESMGELAGGIAEMLQSLADIGGGGRIEVGAGFADDTSKDGAWGAFRITQGGRDLVNWSDSQTGRWAPREFADGEAGYKSFVDAVAVSTRDAIAKIELPRWARTIADAFGDAPSAEQVGQMVQAIVDGRKELDRTATELRNYGGIFLQIAASTDDAKAALLGLMGGIEGLTQAAQGFVGTYYTKEEQASIMARQVAESLRGAGVNIGGLNTLSEYRALLEGTAPSEANAPKIAALLQNAGAFAQIVGYLSSAGDSRTLAQLANTMPALSFLQELEGATGSGTSSADDSATTAAAGAQSITTAVDTGLLDVRTGIADLRTDVDEMSVAVTGAINAMQAAMDTLLTSIAVNTASTANQLRSWDDGGALSTVTAA
jgi:hypothetical protein